MIVSAPMGLAVKQPCQAMPTRTRSAATTVSATRASAASMAVAFETVVVATRSVPRQQRLWRWTPVSRSKLPPDLRRQPTLPRGAALPRHWAWALGLCGWLITGCSSPEPQRLIDVRGGTAKVADVPMSLASAATSPAACFGGLVCLLSSSCPKSRSRQASASRSPMFGLYTLIQGARGRSSCTARPLRMWRICSTTIMMPVGRATRSRGGDAVI